MATVVLRRNPIAVREGCAHVAHAAAVGVLLFVNNNHKFPWQVGLGMALSKVSVTLMIAHAHGVKLPAISSRFTM